MSPSHLIILPLGSVWLAGALIMQISSVLKDKWDYNQFLGQHHKKISMLNVQPSCFPPQGRAGSWSLLLPWFVLSYRVSAFLTVPTAAYLCMCVSVCACVCVACRAHVYNGLNQFSKIKETEISQSVTGKLRSQEIWPSSFGSQGEVGTGDPLISLCCAGARVLLWGGSCCVLLVQCGWCQIFWTNCKIILRDHWSMGCCCIWVSMEGSSTLCSLVTFWLRSLVTGPPVHPNLAAASFSAGTEFPY